MAMRLVFIFVALLGIGGAAATPVPAIFKHGPPPDVLNMVAVSNKFPTNLLTDLTHGDELLKLGQSAIDEYRKVFPSHMRRFHFCEIFAGKGELSKACWGKGLRGAAFDKLLHPKQNMATLEGFVWAGILILSIVEGGLVWFAPQCSTWLNFMCAVYMSRTVSNSYEGNTKRADVRDGNACARCVAYLISMCVSRGVRWVIENPMSSHLFKYPELLKAMVECGGVRSITYGGAFGWNSLKPFFIVTNLNQDLVSAFLMKSRTEARRELATRRGSPLTKVSGNKKMWTNGKHKALSQSSAYTSKFGNAVADMLRGMFE